MDIIIIWKRIDARKDYIYLAIVYGMLRAKFNDKRLKLLRISITITK